MSVYHVDLDDRDRAVISARAALRAHVGDDRRASAAGRVLVDAMRLFLNGTGAYEDIGHAADRVRVQISADSALVELAASIPRPVAE